MYAGHGGVYVPATEETPRNPYLSHIYERDITTPSGRPLTLVNPAYMTRQVFTLGQIQYGLQGHITSLHPLRPQNAPDPWETQALQSFEQEYTWYVREGYLVRSPWSVNGVEVDRDKREKAELEYIADIKEEEGEGEEESKD